MRSKALQALLQSFQIWLIEEGKTPVTSAGYRGLVGSIAYKRPDLLGEPIDPARFRDPDILPQYLAVFADSRASQKAAAWKAFQAFLDATSPSEGPVAPQSLQEALEAEGPPVAIPPRVRLAIADVLKRLGMPRAMLAVLEWRHVRFDGAIGKDPENPWTTTYARVPHPQNPVLSGWSHIRPLLGWKILWEFAGGNQNGGKPDPHRRVIEPMSMMP